MSAPNRPPHPAKLPPKKTAQAATDAKPTRPPHPATVVQRSDALPPHPAAPSRPEAVQRRVIEGCQRPPHPATVAQRSNALPPHPAVAQPSVESRPRRSAFERSRYSGFHPYKSERLNKKYGRGGGGGGEPPRPPKCPCGKLLWNGQRPSFSDEVVERVLSDGDHTCVKCGKKLPRKKDRIGDEAFITVDHKKDWLTHILNTVDIHRFTDKNENCWEGYYKSEVTDAYNDEDNLQPMCSSCNSSKSGSKAYDRGNPTKYLGKKDKSEDEKE